VADGCGRGRHWSRFLGSCVWNPGYVYRGDVHPAYAYPGYAYPAYGYRALRLLTAGVDNKFCTSQSPGIVWGFLFRDRVVDVRFGSKADMTLSHSDVCFTPGSGHSSVRRKCPLSAHIRHTG